jgi:hypothetical protein
VRGQQVFTDRLDLGDYPFILFEHIKELIVVHFEFLLLEQNNSGTLRNWDSLSIEALCFPDKLHDIDIKVDVKFLLGLMPYN